MSKKSKALLVLVPAVVFYDIIGWYLLNPYIDVLISEYGSQVYIKWFLYTSLVVLWFPVIYTFVRVYIDWWKITFLKRQHNFKGKEYWLQSLSPKATVFTFIQYLIGLPAALGWFSLLFK